MRLIFEYQCANIRHVGGDSLWSPRCWEKTSQRHADTSWPNLPLIVVVLPQVRDLEALRFHQRRGFVLARPRPGAVDKSRASLKPQISTMGEFGIPIRDEIELELRFDAPSA